jgi:hypothetical protein
MQHVVKFDPGLESDRLTDCRIAVKGQSVTIGFGDKVGDLQRIVVRYLILLPSRNYGRTLLNGSHDLWRHAPSTGAPHRHSADSTRQHR